MGRAWERRKGQIIMETIRFDELQLSNEILRAVEDMGFEAASPIQAQAIPAQLDRKSVV